MVKHWQNTDQILVKCWSNTGQILVKYWSNTCWFGAPRARCSAANFAILQRLLPTRLRKIAPTVRNGFDQYLTSIFTSIFDQYLTALGSLSATAWPAGRAGLCAELSRSFVRRDATEGQPPRSLADWEALLMDQYSFRVNGPKPVALGGLGGIVNG